MGGVVTSASVLGAFAIEVDGKPVQDALPGRQVPLLVARLALAGGRTVSRDELVGLLWPDDAPAEPDDALTVLLSKLRRGLGSGPLEGRRDLRLVLAPDAVVDWDEAFASVASAHAALAAGDPATALEVAQRAAHQAAAGFMKGYGGPWVDERRRELDLLHQDALAAIASAGLALGGAGLAPAERAARELVESAPLRESAHRLLMEVLAARGDVAHALEVYEGLRSRLADELGVAPSADIAALHLRLVTGGDAPAPPPREHRPVADALTEGLRALEAGRWDEAHATFTAVLETDDVPEAHDGLGRALFYLGDLERSVAERAIAVDGYARANRCDDAARAAVWIANQHWLAGRPSAARGWLARAERGLAGMDRCAGLGWLAVARARHADDLGVCIEQAETALEIAAETDDADLEIFALSVLGGAQIRTGRITEGMALLEEALAAATAGRAHNLHTLGEAYCNLIGACVSAGEWQRAQEWCELVDDFARDTGAMPLFGACRTVHADVLVAFGRWPEAERALEDALTTHARWIPSLAAPTVTTLAELRVRQGRLGEARRLLEDREEHPAALRALALLRVAEGRPGVAAALLERGLRLAGDGDAVGAALLLAPLVDARLACGEAEAAAAVAHQLDALATGAGVPLIRARADLALARVERASGNGSSAVEPARRALAGFSALGMPLETAEARLELARALEADAPDLAEEEERAAVETFRRLGAVHAVTDPAVAAA